MNVASYGLTPGGFPTGAGPGGQFQATWTLASSGIETDKLLIHLSDAVTGLSGNALDGEWDNPIDLSDPSSDLFPSNNTVAGGSFQFRFNVLPGDASGNGSVSLGDLGVVATNFNQASIDGDFNGDHMVSLADLGTLASNFSRGLPGGEPAAPSGARPWPPWWRRSSTCV